MCVIILFQMRVNDKNVQISSNAACPWAMTTRRIDILHVSYYTLELMTSGKKYLPWLVTGMIYLHEGRVFHPSKPV